MKNDLPKGWMIKEFGDFVFREKGKYQPNPLEEKPCIELEHLNQNTGNINGYTNSGFQASTKNVFKKGQVLFGKLRPYLQKYWLAEFDGVCSSEIWVLNSDGTFCENNYLFRFVQSNEFIQTCGVTSGSKMPRADWDYVCQYPVQLPPLPEQQEIAQILSTWDEAIQTTQHLLEKLESRKKGMMQRLLNRKGNEKNAGIVFKTFSEKNHPNEPLLSATQDRGVIPRTMLAGRVASPDGSTNGYKLVQEGDFIISLRSFEGGLEYSEYRGIISPAYTILQPKVPIERSFYKHFFKSERFIRKLGVAVIGIRDGKQISFEDFSIIKIPFPPIEEQTTIAKILNTADTEIQETKAYLKTLKQQKKGLMQQLLTGKIIVKTK